MGNRSMVGQLICYFQVYICKVKFFKVFKFDFGVFMVFYGEFSIDDVGQKVECEFKEMVFEFV